MVADRGGRRNNVYFYFFVNDRIMYSPTTSPYGYSSFLKEESLITIDFWHTFMGAFPSRCPISFVSLLNLLQLAAQFLSPCCSVLFSSLLNLRWPRGEFTSARCLVTTGDSHKKTPDRNSSIGSFLCRLFLILRTAGRLLRHP